LSEWINFDECLYSTWSFEADENESILQAVFNRDSEIANGMISMIIFAQTISFVLDRLALNKKLGVFDLATSPADPLA
jgi:hypothetical protein